MAEVIKRVATGVKGFDELIENGFIDGSSVAVIGAPGTGKTIFGLHFLYQGLLNGEKGVYFSFKQETSSLEMQCKQFGWNTDAKKNAGIKFVKLNGVDLFQEIQRLEDEARIFGATRVVVDSISDLMEYLPNVAGLKKLGLTDADGTGPLSISPKDFARRVNTIFIDRMKRLGTITIFIADSLENGNTLSRDGVTEFTCDGIILLKATSLGDELHRSVEVRKMRNTAVAGGIQSVSIGTKGMSVGSTR